MKRLIITVFILLLSGVSAFSQIKFGGQLGLNFSSASYTASEGYTAATTKSKAFLMGGLLAEFKLSDMFYIQPEINYVPRGIEYDPLVNVFTGADMPGTSGTFTLDYTEIPILIKAKFGQDQLKPYLMIGPNFGFLNTSEVELRNTGSTTTTDTKDQNESINFLLDFGGGVEYAINPQIDVFANLKYSLGLVDILKDENFSHKTNGLQFSVGIKFCITGCDEKEEVVIPQTPPPVVDKKRTREVIKELDLGKYDVPFFVSGYYRPNTTENLDNIYELRKDELKNATYIENFAKGSPKYDQYKTWAQQVENIFHVITTSSNEEIFRMFKNQSGSNDILEISVYGYADPRAITGKYFESKPVQFDDITGKTNVINKGDDLDNLKLSGLRAYNTGLYLEKIYIKTSEEGKSDFSDLKSAGKIKFRYIGAGVTSDSQNLEAQRRVKIIFTRINN